MNEDKRYEVMWGYGARLHLAKMKQYKINPNLVFRNSKQILEINPQSKAYDVVNWPDFEFNGYYWTYINNVIIVYDVLDMEKKGPNRCLLLCTHWFCSKGFLWRARYRSLIKTILSSHPTIISPEFYYFQITFNNLF